MKAPRRIRFVTDTSIASWIFTLFSFDKATYCVCVYFLFFIFKEQIRGTQDGIVEPTSWHFLLHLASDHYERHLSWRYRPIYCEHANRIPTFLFWFTIDQTRHTHSKRSKWAAFSHFFSFFAEPPKIRKDYRSIVRANVMERVQISCPFYQQSGDSAGLFFRWTKVIGRRTV